MGVNGMYLLSAGVLEADKGLFTYRVDMGKKSRRTVHGKHASAHSYC